MPLAGPKEEVRSYLRVSINLITRLPLCLCLCLISFCFGSDSVWETPNIFSLDCLINSLLTKSAHLSNITNIRRAPFRNPLRQRLWLTANFICLSLMDFTSVEPSAGRDRLKLKKWNKWVDSDLRVLDFQPINSVRRAASIEAADCSLNDAGFRAVTTERVSRQIRCCVALFEAALHFSVVSLLRQVQGK